MEADLEARGLLAQLGLPHTAILRVTDTTLTPPAMGSAAAPSVAAARHPAGRATGSPAARDVARVLQGLHYGTHAAPLSQGPTWQQQQVASSLGWQHIALIKPLGFEVKL